MPYIFSLLFIAFTAAACARETPVKDLPPATPEAINASITRGVGFLITDQNKNGSWGSVTRTKNINIYAPLPGAHHAYRAGASGLALSGLLDSADNRPETTAAISKAAAWSVENLPKLRRAEQTTTYNIWGHAYGLRSLVRLHERETDPGKKALYKTLAQEQVDLVNRYEDITAAGDTSMCSMISPRRNPPASPPPSAPPPSSSPCTRAGKNSASP